MDKEGAPTVVTVHCQQPASLDFAILQFVKIMYLHMYLHEVIKFTIEVFQIQGKAKLLIFPTWAAVFQLKM